MAAPAIPIRWTSPVWRFWTVLTVIGSLILAINLGHEFWSASPSFRETYLYHGTGALLWWLALPLARWATWRFPFGPWNSWRVLATQIAIGGVAGLIAWFVFSLRLLVANQLPPGFFPLVLADTFDWDDLYIPAILAYGVLALPFYAADFYENWQVKQREAAELQLANAQLETRLVRASLDALKMQLHPHFLFNTLNSITALIRRQRMREAEDIVAGLGDLLRRSLEHRQDLKVTLDGELKFLQRYFEIESIRFQGRLQVEIAVDPECDTALVPSLILQPLVENAMKHGFSKTPDARVLRITARRDNGQLCLGVYNDGPFLPVNGAASVTAGHGIGTQNTRARLQMMYGDTARFTLTDTPPKGVTAEVHLPFQTSAHP
ncbi:MAG TPA: histidine kinase [Candidatus Didemnitutus sp.]|nr:histidine kinase [Candidatus Didemnitutus sp.]